MFVHPCQHVTVSCFQMHCLFKPNLEQLNLVQMQHHRYVEEASIQLYGFEGVWLQNVLLVNCCKGLSHCKLHVYVSSTQLSSQDTYALLPASINSQHCRKLNGVDTLCQKLHKVHPACYHLIVTSVRCDCPGLSDSPILHGILRLLH